MLGISPSYGGTEAVVLSMLPFWQLHGFVFDFINTYEQPLCREEALTKNGGKIIPLNLRRRGRVLAYRRSIRAFFADHANDYDGIWLNMQEPEHARFLAEAKKSGILQRIVVAHYAGFGAESSWLRSILLRMGRRVINKAATIRIAVSSSSGEYAFRGYPYSVVNSGVDCARFAFDDGRREVVRNALSVSTKTRLYISAGRLTKSKNQHFLLDVYHDLSKSDPGARFLLVGRGEMEQDLRSYAKQLDINNLQFVTDCDDISPYLDAADVFVFPSLHEGLGMVLLEAQCSGLPCFASDHVIPKEVGILDTFTWVGLDQGSSKWADLIASCSVSGADQRKKAVEMISNAGLTKEEVAQKYLRILNGN